MRGRQEGRWYDADAGPLVRPYTEVPEAADGTAVESGTDAGRASGATPLDLGFSEPAGAGSPDLLARVSHVPSASADTLLGPEHAALLDSCRRAAHPSLSVAELAVTTGRPVGVVRVLLGDLCRRGHLRLTAPGPSLPGQHVETADILGEVIDAIRAL